MHTYRVIVSFSCALVACTTTEVSDGKQEDPKAAIETKAPADGETKQDTASRDAAKSPQANPQGLRNPHERPKPKQVPPPPDVAEPPADATRTESGLAYKVLAPGTGEARPGPNDSVQVEYTGWTTDGATFDTTVDRGPRRFPVGKVIAGWTEGLQLMHVGERVRFWIPEELAYKGRSHGPQGMLVFEVELREIFAAPPVPGDVAGPPANAKTTASGLAYRVLERGTGKEHPRAWDRVKVEYSGWTTDGKMFDSTTNNGRPASFELDKVIAGWTEGIQTMVTGEKTRFWIPEKLAYEGKAGGPAGALVFDVQLLEIDKKPEPPKTPEDVAAPPPHAKTTESGLAYVVLQPGTGTRHPTRDARVEVHYSGWTTDGKMFDSSVTRGKPSSFHLSGVIKGWTEGLQLMVEGEKTRFWIPKELAYGDRAGKPSGMLVFDVELISIK